MFDAKFTGMEQLIRKSRGLSHAVRVKLARNAVMAGARVIRDRAQQLAYRLDDQETGRRIGDNVAARYRKGLSEQTGDPTASVGVLMTRGKIPKNNPDEPQNTNHWHILHQGTERIAANPFLTNAAQQTQAWIPQQVANSLERGITRELKKL